jgi:hypothetical protein
MHYISHFEDRLETDALLAYIPSGVVKAGFCAALDSAYRSDIAGREANLIAVNTKAAVFV